jgi:hypothetical protein
VTLEEEAQAVAEKHLEACYEALWWEETDGIGDAPESPAIAPFCGCTTCVVREVLFASLEYLLAIKGAIVDERFEERR